MEVQDRDIDNMDHNKLEVLLQHNKATRIDCIYLQ
jgi:hypothetical protein